MKGTATAIWKGDLKTGQGTFSANSGAFTNTPYSFKNRFEGEPGATPEELIASAHAACFSMAFSGNLGKAGITPESIETTCDITMEGGVLTTSDLKTTVTALGADQSAIREAGEAARTGCPISKALNLEKTLELTILPA